MTLTKLKIPPGLAKNGTPYSNTGRWYDANLVRWFEGAMRPIGGWSVLAITVTTNSTYEAGEAVELNGVPRECLAWKALDSTSVLAVGTETALYAYAEGDLTDISPTGLIAGGPSALWRAYGDGPYGGGPYGRGTPLENAPVVQPGSWQLDTFGEILVGVLSSDGQIYKWERGVDATAVEAVTTSTTLESCIGLVVTPERFLVALGTNGYPRQISWSSQETIDDFDLDPNDPLSTAGNLDLQGSGALLCGARGRNETLLWTESDLYALRYQGAPLIYGVERLGTNCGPISSRSFAMIDGTAIWMGNSSFFMYDGYVKPLPSEVGDFIFSDLNFGQAAKVRAWPVAQYGEVWFSYPSRLSEENDRIAVFNYREGHWMVHSDFPRTAGVDRGGFENPILCDPTGHVYLHEKVNNWDHRDFYSTAVTGFETTEIGEVYAETAPIEIGEGERTMLIRQFVPDTRNGAGYNRQAVTMFATAAFYPTAEDDTGVDAEVVYEHGPFPTTQPSDCFIAGRQVRIKVEQTVEGADWRFGDLRADIVQMGKK